MGNFHYYNVKYFLSKVILSGIIINYLLNLRVNTIVIFGLIQYEKNENGFWKYLGKGRILYFVPIIKFYYKLKKL